MILVFQYQNSPIQFEVIDGQVMANATVMAKAFGKEPDSIFKTKNWKEFELALIDDTEMKSEDLRTSKMGSPENGGGSWIHQELVIEFARRLNARFALWCNRKIADLLKDGTASVNDKLKPSIPNFDDPIAAAQAWIEEKKKQIALQAENVKLTEEVDKKESEIKRLEPMASFADKLMNTGTTVDISTYAKIIGWGPNVLFERLRLDKILISTGERKNLPYQEHINSDRFKVIPKPWGNKSTGKSGIHYQARLTGKGMLYLFQKYVPEKKKNRIGLTVLEVIEYNKKESENETKGLQRTGL